MDAILGHNDPPDPPPKQRERFVRAAAELFRVRGYNATGTADIVARAGAPKGSLYHYFPGGKEEIAKATVAHAGQVVAGSLQAIGAGSAAARLMAYGEMLAGWMEASGCREGCPIATTVLELAPDSEGIARLGAAAFADWASVFAADLAHEGVTTDRARRLGRLAVTALEGALLIARAEVDAAIIRDACGEVAALFSREAGSGRSSDEEPAG